MTSAGVPVADAGVDLGPDPSRAITRFFVPGHEDVGPGDSRAAPVIERLLALDDDEVSTAVRLIDERFADRHQNLHSTFARHADMVAHRLDPTWNLAPLRQLLLGASFTHEYTIEAAALCNPSIVALPDQPGNGSTAFVMSVRGIGEGHRSSIGFRTGAVSESGAVTIDAPGPYPCAGEISPGVHHRSVLHRKLGELHDDHENAAYVLDSLPHRFGDEELQERMAALGADAATRRNTTATSSHLERLASCSYRAQFDPATEVSERVLYPHSAAERNGMEDARFVEISDGSAPRYCGTYTAYDGADISQHLVTTEDFASFEIAPMAGRAAQGKGLALFPRLVGGRYVALSRAGRETNSIAYSDDIRVWDTFETIQTPRHAWELLQLGNCGSPIETERGWLVLTHGVGPMRTYSIGAMLLDLDSPERVIGCLSEPLLVPGRHQRDGYVPNVVYCCGALSIGDRLVIPYGVGDQRIAVATVSLPALLDALEQEPTSKS